MIYTITNKTQETQICPKARVAASFYSRLLGYMFKSSIAVDEALIFYNAPSIHMFFMRFPLDIVFLGEDNKVIKIYSHLAPWRLANCLFSRVTIELPAGKVDSLGLAIGDILKITSNT
jgi:uncharacterized protein